MSTDRISEILNGPFQEVFNDASLLKIERRQENEHTFRYRVAYAMQAHILKEEGKAVPEKAQRRMDWLEAGNILEEGELMPI